MHISHHKSIASATKGRKVVRQEILPTILCYEIFFNEIFCKICSPSAQGTFLIKSFLLESR